MDQGILCDICGSSERKILFDRGRDTTSCANAICQRCGFVYLISRKDKDELRSYYSTGQYSLDINNRMDLLKPDDIKKSEEIAWLRFRKLSTIMDLHSQTPKRFLEIGCGLGSFLRLMSGAGWDILGLEPDPTRVEAAKHEYRIPLQPHFYEDTVFPDNCFDLVASFHVLEHVSSPRIFLNKVRKEIKPGGKLYLEVPCIEHPYRGDLDRFFWSLHLSTFSKNTLLGLLEQVGFRILKSGYSGDFLWVLAENDSFSPCRTPVYPLDKPEVVWRRTHRIHKHFLFRQSLSSRTDPISRLNLSFQNALQAYVDKLDLGPRLALQSFGRRIISITKVATESSIIKVSNKLPGHIPLVHVGVHGLGNAGDVMLLVAVRKLFDMVNGSCNWSLEHVYSEVSPEIIRRINNEMKGLVIGGGGLFLPDTNRNQRSGWIWNCSIEQLRNIRIPIFVFAVGYNRFREQEDFNPIFSSNIQELVERSAFFGLRSRGSIRNLSHYLNQTLVPKLVFQPCPTTLLKYLYPQYMEMTSRDTTKRLSLNVAFDRRKLRFGDLEDGILQSIASTMKWANNHGWEIYLAIHVSTDAQVIPWLIRHGVIFKEVNLATQPYQAILEFYSKMHLSIGMRSHSQLIPFGLGKPIISVISHDKLSFFLDDIDHPEWGVDIKAPKFNEKLISKIKIADSDRYLLIKQISQAQEVLWNITLSNTKIISDALNI
jgi:SAM-dependent methyltransferase/polysaccharide pyruvyl transferase WcaK-like protein